MVFLYIYFCICPKHFVNIMHFVYMVSHITCTFCSELYINCHVYMSMCLYSLQFFLFCFVLECLVEIVDFCIQSLFLFVHLTT